MKQQKQSHNRAGKGLGGGGWHGGVGLKPGTLVAGRGLGGGLGSGPPWLENAPGGVGRLRLRTCMTG